MKVVITGSAGLQGSRLAERLRELGHYVIGVDDYSRGSNHPHLSEAWTMDARNLNARMLDGVDAVYHLAAELGGVRYSHDHHWQMFRNNVSLDTAVFDACAKAGVSTVVFPSSACAYPLHKQTEWDSVLTEDDMWHEPEPESGYGWAKLMGEVALRYLDVPNRVVFRLFNVYGEGESSSEGSHVIPELIKKALDAPEGGELHVYGTGQQGRAFLFVEDAIDAYVKALDITGQATMNVGNPVPVRIATLAEKVAALADKDLSVVFDEQEPTGVFGRTPDIARAGEIMGWTPSTDLDEGLRRTFEYYRRLR